MYRLCVDTREHDLIMMIPKLIETYAVPIEMCVEPLDIGDIEVRRDTQTLCVFERKTLSDLVSSITDGRYKEQCLRLKKACPLPDTSKYYLIEGDIMRYTPRKRGRPVNKTVLYGVITSLTYGKGFHVMKTTCLQETAELLVRFADKARRIDEKGGTGVTGDCQSRDCPRPGMTGETNRTTGEKGETECYSSVIHKVKHKNITPENIGIICLSQIPYVSTTIATELIRKYGTLRECINQVCDCPDELSTIKVNGRKLSSRVIQNIKLYLAQQHEVSPSITVDTREPTNEHT